MRIVEAISKVFNLKNARQKDKPFTYFPSGELDIYKTFAQQVVSTFLTIYDDKEPEEGWVGINLKQFSPEHFSIHDFGLEIHSPQYRLAFIQEFQRIKNIPWEENDIFLTESEFVPLDHKAIEGVSKVIVGPRYVPTQPRREIHFFILNGSLEEIHEDTRVFLQLRSTA